MDRISAIVLILGILIAWAVWLTVRAKEAQHLVENLSRRLAELELELFRLKRDRESGRPVHRAGAASKKYGAAGPAASPRGCAARGHSAPNSTRAGEAGCDPAGSANSARAAHAPTRAAAPGQAGG